MALSVHDLFMAPWLVQVVAASVRFNLFTLLGDSDKSAQEVAEQCGAVPGRLEALLDACAALGLVHRRGDRFCNAHFSRIYLVEGAERYFGDMIKHQQDVAPRWYRLYDVISGKDLPQPEDDEAGHKNFIRAMHNLGKQGEAEALKNALDLGGCRKMADIGGGSGLYSLVLCEKYPTLQSTILDRGETLALTREYIKGRKEAGRITLREGDYFLDDFGGANDVVLLSDVVYGESETALVLKKAWASLKTGGFLVIRGYYTDPDGSTPLFGALFVLNDLLFDPASKMLTVSSLEKLMEEAGFTRIQSSALTVRSTLVVARK